NLSNCGGCVDINSFQNTDYGLMVELGEIQRFPSSNSRTWRRDLIPADGDLANIDDCRLATNTPPSLYDLYDGDLWEPSRDVQLSAWTRPNIQGFSTAAQVPSGYPLFPVIDNIRYVSGSTTIAFDYYDDPFTLPYVSIREDSWMGPETNNRSFEGQVRVKSGVTLTFDGGDTGTLIDFEEGIFVETGGAVRIGDNVTLRFGSGERLIVNGTLDSFGADGVTLAPIPCGSFCSTGNDTWGGVYYRPGSSGTLRNTTITDVVGSPGTSIYVWNANVTLEGVTLQDGAGDGLFVTGSNADVTMRSSALGSSRILDHNQHNGVVATSGANVILDDVIIRNSGLAGVYADDGADIFMRLSTVDESGENGAKANDNGRVVFGHVGLGGLITGQNNLVADSQTSTLSSQLGATIYGGGAGVKFDFNYRHNWFRLNSGNPNQKHATIGYAEVIAECNYWDEPTGPDLARVSIGGYGTFDGSPFLYDPPAISTTCGTTPPSDDLTTSGGTFARGTAAGMEGAKDDGSEEGGPPQGMSEDRWLAIAEGAENPDRNVGIGHVVSAIQRARTPFETQRGFDVAAQLGRNEAHPGLEGFLHGQSRTRKHGGYAHAALAEVYYGTGRHDEARATATTLTTEYAGTDHARRGWLTLHAVARDAGDFAEAEAALAALRAGWPEHETELLERALAVASEGDLVEGGGASAPGTPRTAAPSVQASTVDGTVPTTTELRAPYPNPTASGVTVPLALARDAEVTFWLVNTLGQRVRALEAQTARAGVHAYEIDTAGLAPGVYLVQATVRTQAATEQFTRTLTVVR
ncbi:MAG: T9SS type A sorting domain-containing protein, partial [Bacteroidota bacterium]